MQTNSTPRQEQTLTVTQFLYQVNQILKKERTVVRGEVGKINLYSERGFGYFNLKDNQSSMNCFFWTSNVEPESLSLLEEGLEVEVSGFGEIYQKEGRFNFHVLQLWLKGEGILKKKFEALKSRLEKEGLFKPERKKLVPVLAQRIGLITAIDSAALSDFKRNLGQFGLTVSLYPIQVSGRYGANQILEAIQWFNENMPELDVLVLTRGGGSWESLQPFNEESVARKIVASRIPVLVGVGHEKDITIAGLVADMRVSTPTACSKYLSQGWEQNKRRLLELNTRMSENLKFYLELKAQDIERFRGNIEARMEERLTVLERRVTEQYRGIILAISHLMFFLKNLEEKVARQQTDIKAAMTKKIDDTQRCIQQEKDKLFSLDPRRVLKQGYSIARTKTGQVVKTVDQIDIGQELNINFSKGGVLSQIKKLFR